MIRRPPRSTLSSSSAASDVYKRQVEDIIREAKKINPYVIIICEPWGGGYDPEGFSLRGWGSWNDQIRNGIKGENPVNGLGWIFGHWYGDNNPDRIKSYVNGTLVQDKKGLFQKKEHSVNYLESHDGYTFGDFIRIGTKDVRPDDIINDIDSNALLSAAQLKLNKLGALFLFTSQGITMMHSGQEFARSKVIARSYVKDKNVGKLDHNSYEKDNETNYINYHDFIVLFNAAQKVDEEFKLPQGNWDILVNPLYAGIVKLGDAFGKIVVNPVSGFVLRKRK